jgi:hypothetical protein
MNGWERHARASWALAAKVWGGIDGYHRYRKNRPAAQKVKLGCLAFVVLWVPFVIPFIVYGYIAMAAAAVTAYALLATIPWGVSIGVAKIRAARAARSSP